MKLLRKGNPRDEIILKLAVEAQNSYIKYLEETADSEDPFTIAPFVGMVRTVLKRYDRYKNKHEIK